jgi:predicted PurR-regulated permease PerM
MLWAHRNTEERMARLDKIAESSWILTLASIAVVIAVLYLAKGVLIPFTLAVLLSFLLSPVCDWLERRRRLGRIPAVLVTAILGFSVIGIVAWTAVVQITQLTPNIPQYRHNIEAKLNSLNDYAAAMLSKVTSTAQEMGQDLSPTEPVHEPRGTFDLPFSVRIVSSPASPLQVFGGMFGTLIEVLGTTGVVIVLVVFFLFRREDLRDRFIHLVGKGQVTVTTQTLEDAGARVSRYLLILFFLNVTFGICVGVGLFLIGVPHAILWGILAGILRFIPYLGPSIAAATPIGLSMAISTGWGATISTAGLFLVLELFNNNFLEPWLYGKNIGVSPVAIMVAAVFWTWLWGPVGLLLATPLTVCVLVVGKHVPQLSFLDILLGTEPVFDPKERVYQRLLAGDQEEAAELFEEYLEHKPPVEVYDTVLIPALAMAETHWQLGELNESKHKFIMQCLKEMIQDRGEREQEKLMEKDSADLQESDEDSRRVEGSNSSRLSILCLPARTEADEITALMLAQVLEAKGRVVQTVAVTSLAAKMDEPVDQRIADVVCISATPPAAVMHARYLCRRLRDRLSNVKLVVGLWESQGDLNKAQERIGCGAIVVSTLVEAQVQIQRL